MNPALRFGDFIKCTDGCSSCPKCPDGKIIQGSPNTFINNKPAARKDDKTSNCCGCCCPCPNKILTGSTKTFINGKSAASNKSKISRGKPITFSNNTFV